jgi:hypothetical protein
MNKNSYSNLNWDYICNPPISLGHSLEDYIRPKKKKEKTMENFKEFPFHIGWDSYKTLEEATKAARRRTMESKEDTVIRQNIAVVKFPVPDYEVETLATVA